eukprot:5498833-Pleurochrysis_carterae.AAC.2
MTRGDTMRTTFLERTLGLEPVVPSAMIPCVGELWQRACWKAKHLRLTYHRCRQAAEPYAHDVAL